MKGHRSTGSFTRARTGGRRGRRAVLTAITVVALLGLAAAGPPAGAQEGPSELTEAGTPLAVSDVVEGAKSASGRAAQTDPSLLELDSSAPVSVMVKLDYDALAAYAGGIEGLPATSPSVTGERLDPESPAAQAYDTYVEGVEETFVAALDDEIPAAEVGESMRIVYGGVTATVPGDQIATLASLPGVAAVQPNDLRQLTTDSSPEFIGAPPVYTQLGGTPSAGAGIIVGVLDSGSWPEHPSYADPGDLPAPRPTLDGAPRACNFGDNPLTPAADPFVCNSKLIGGRPFIATYNAVFGGEVFPTSARDSNGHGTHTSTTAAGGPVADANPLGISRGPIHGIAPAAAVSVYKVCGARGCFPADSVAAVARAILDDVDVINFSISGGTEPFADSVELAFLDAYAAGVFVATSAGNEGPGAGTVNHLGPWVSSAAASTQEREFTSTVTLAGAVGATATLTGATVTAGIASPLPVVLGSAPPYNNAGCEAPAPPGLFTGKIVVCMRGPGRIARGFNVFTGGAAGMLLANPVQSETLTDNHFLPTVHLEKPEADSLLAFVAANTTTTASFTTGAASAGQADVVVGFSSRGPGGDFLKPDIAAPGAQILAGNTPVPEAVSGGPPGNLYQAIAGTSMASPHVAGAAALLMDLHPDWTPGQVRSALNTTATTDMTKTDRVTPADAFDMGSGRLRVDRAANPGLTFDTPAADFAAIGAGALPAIDANIASVNSPAMPGSVTTTRTATNVTSGIVRYRATPTAPAGATITVSPRNIVLDPGDSVDLTITISAPGLAPGQYFGAIALDDRDGDRDLHVPVAFAPGQGDLSLTQACAPITITRPDGRSTCTVTMRNDSRTAATVQATTHLDQGLRVAGVGGGATQSSIRDAVFTTDLDGFVPAKPIVAPDPSAIGYIPLDRFGGTLMAPIGDEQAVNVNVPGFVYAEETYNRIGVTSNGYIVVGGAVQDDVDFSPQVFPDPERPNNVLAPFWTDLDGTGAPGILVNVLTDGVNAWIVVEWRVNVFGSTSRRVFQTWLGMDGAEDVTFAYDPANLPADPLGLPFNVGAENVDGSGGSQIAGLPVEDLRVASQPSAPGESATYTVTVRGLSPGAQNVTTSATAPIVNGTTTEVDTVNVL